ncbi:MAG: hypothetical protein COY40_06650 [Alphaproteobacteria bacterium CG_4_10_14_0_8_um_filter_53_9]|nr:MAG: hypothetical protein COY40_06650 [Alphaproteobacteria bacterium CG_4_10_14_0_8_um_filter_53_9]
MPNVNSLKDILPEPAQIRINDYKSLLHVVEIDSDGRRETITTQIIDWEIWADKTYEACISFTICGRPCWLNLKGWSCSPPASSAYYAIGREDCIIDLNVDACRPPKEMTLESPSATAGLVFLKFLSASQGAWSKVGQCLALDITSDGFYEEHWGFFPMAQPIKKENLRPSKDV